MITRRGMLASGALMPVLGLTAGAARAAPGDAPGSDWLSQFGFKNPEIEITQPASVTGTAPALAEEVTKAFGLLFGAPRDAKPFDVAQYFEGLTLKNKDGEHYNAEWASRWNPVIVGFFCMTHQLPNAGDQTSWCAAFANWCLGASGRPLTYSALAVSFASYPTVNAATEDPQIGDLVVFRDRSDPNHGHVGFFAGWDKSTSDVRIKVLGGNQRGNTGTTGAVTTVSFSKDHDKNLEFHSFRSLA